MLSCEIYPSNRAVSAPAPCLTQRTATIPLSPLELVSGTSPASLLSAGLRLPASSAAQPAASTPFNWGTDVPQQPAALALYSTVLIPDNASVNAEIASLRLHSTSLNMGRAAQYHPNIEPQHHAERSGRDPQGSSSQRRSRRADALDSDESFDGDSVNAIQSYRGPKQQELRP